MLAMETGVNARCELLERISRARQQSDALFKVVRERAVYERPIPERHRIIFYIGHLEAFDWNLLHEHALGLKAFHPEFDRLFAFGIDPVGGGLPSDQPADWPRLAEVNAYNLHVREELNHILKDHSQASAGRWQYPCETILNTAIE